MNRIKTYSLLLIALIALIGFIVWLLRSNSRDSQPSSSGTEQSTKNLHSTTSSHAVIEPKDPTAAFLSGRIQTVSEYLGEESFRLVGCMV
jgi:flagellar biogenesis protein FliO